MIQNYYLLDLPTTKNNFSKFYLRHILYCFIFFVLIIYPSSRAAKVAKRQAKVAEYCNSINGKVRSIANSKAPVSLFDIE